MNKFITSLKIACIVIFTSCDITSPLYVTRDYDSRGREVENDQYYPCFNRSLAEKTSDCPTNVDLVCGCDGKTYKNACEANRAGMYVRFKGDCALVNQMNRTYNKSEPDKHPCFNQKLQNNQIEECPTVQVPVCGCDGNTYINACSANKVGIRVVHIGPCKE